MITIEYNKPNKLKCKQSAFLTSPYDLELIEAVRQLKERKWFDNRWEINAEKVDWLKSQLPNHTFNEIGTKLVVEKKDEVFEFPKTKTTPKNHQLEGFNFMMNKKKCALNDGMGCLSGDTLIETEQGHMSIYTLYKTYKDKGIKTIKCFTSKGIEFKPFKEVVYSGKQETCFVKCGDNSLSLTSNHEVLTKKHGYKPVNKLMLSDYLLDEELDWVEVAQIKSDYNYEHTYDVKMEEPFHNFVANGIVVHNCGKSFQLLSICEANRDKYKHCIIINCINSLKWNWKEEIQKHLEESCCVLGERYNSKGKLKSPSTKDKLDDIKNTNEYYIITNIETLRDKSIADYIAKMCEKGEIGVVVVDEAHKLSNPTTQQAKGLLKLKSEFRIPATGTPLMNSPLDLYIHLKWLEIETVSFGKFKEYYCKFGGFGGKEIVGYKHLDELQKTFDEISLRRLLTEVEDMTDKVYVSDYVELSNEQQKIYDNILNEIKQDIDRISLSPNPLAMLTRLRQATGDTGIISTTVDKSAKLDRAEEIIQEVVESGSKVVIFSNWTTMVNKAFKRFKKYNPAMITGEVIDRQAEKNKFMEDDTCKVIIGTIGAMGTGYTLTAGTVVIFLDKPFTKAMVDQCADRIYRMGTTKNVLIISLIAKGTVDEKIEAIINRKAKLSDALVDGVYNLKDPKVLEFLLE